MYLIQNPLSRVPTPRESSDCRYSVYPLQEVISRRHVHRRTYLAEAQTHQARRGKRGGRRTLEDSSEGDHSIVQMLRKDQDSKNHSTGYTPVKNSFPSETAVVAHCVGRETHNLNWLTSLNRNLGWKKILSAPYERRVFLPEYEEAFADVNYGWGSDFSLEDEFNSYRNRISNRFIAWAVNCRKGSDSTN